MYKFSETSLNRLEKVNKTLVSIINEALSLSPIDFGIASGYRTAEEQFELFKKGRSYINDKWQITSRDQVVTYLDGQVKKSRHQLGQAVDIYAWVGGKTSWEKHHLALVAGTILSISKQYSINITWGATFGSNSFDGFDFPHFQIEV